MTSGTFHWPPRPKTSCRASPQTSAKPPLTASEANSALSMVPPHLAPLPPPPWKLNSTGIGPSAVEGVITDMQRSYLPSDNDTTWPSETETLQDGVLLPAVETANNANDRATTICCSGALK